MDGMGVRFSLGPPNFIYSGICLKKKMSQGDIARILNVHRSYISGLERGARNPSLLTIQKVARALNINAKDLI